MCMVCSMQNTKSNFDIHEVVQAMHMQWHKVVGHIYMHIAHMNQGWVSRSVHPNQICHLFYLIWKACKGRRVKNNKLSVYHMYLCMLMPKRGQQETATIRSSSVYADIQPQYQNIKLDKVVWTVTKNTRKRKTNQRKQLFTLLSKGEYTHFYETVGSIVRAKFWLSFLMRNLVDWLKVLNCTKNKTFRI